MTVVDQFVDRIGRRRSNQLLRLVYAYWLDSQNELWAELIRLIVQIDNTVHRMVDLASVLPGE